MVSLPDRLITRARTRPTGVSASLAEQAARRGRDPTRCRNVVDGSPGRADNGHPHSTARFEEILAARGAGAGDSCG